MPISNMGVITADAQLVWMQVLGLYAHHELAASEHKDPKIYILNKSYSWSKKKFIVNFMDATATY